MATERVNEATIVTRGTMTHRRRAADVDDSRLTAMGLLFESSAALRRVFEHRLEADSSLSAQSFDVLIRLARTPGRRLRMSELAAQSTLTPSGLTRAVDRLEEQGLVTREVCPEDRRGAFAVLTASGQAIMDVAIPSHLAHIDEVIGGVLSPAEEETLTALLRKLRDHLFAGKVGCDEEPAGGCPGA